MKTKVQRNGNGDNSKYCFPQTSQGQKILQQFKHRLNVANRSVETIRNYGHSVEALMNFHSDKPDSIDIDQIIDFLHFLKDEKELNWRTLKIYVAGLRWYYQEILGTEDIDTKDGKRRIRIRQGKGKMDRYTVLCEKVLEELRAYYTSCWPKTYLFNGRYKGQAMSKEGLRHALAAAAKHSGIKKEVNMHILRHCFATHALEVDILVHFVPQFSECLCQ